MTPGARIQAAIELLQTIHAGTSPADRASAAYFRNRRYIGGGDRREVLDLVYSVLRRRAAFDWRIARAAGDMAMPNQDRARLIAKLVLIDAWPEERVAEAFDGGKYTPPPLEQVESRLAKALAASMRTDKTLIAPDAPLGARMEVPAWTLDLLRDTFGDRLEVELTAMLDQADTDLRANLLKGTRAQALEALGIEKIRGKSTHFSPWGIRVHGRPPLATTKAFKDGLVEVQDEGSQLVALLTAPEPGQRVVDFCAGAGGKTLALAAMMRNKGKIVACDVLEGRIDRAATRFARAGVHNIERRALSSERDPWVKRHAVKNGAGGFDRVLVDAPCSGAGTWRRNPDAKWRLHPDDLARLVVLQASILESAARLVKVGGRLVYATCSLFRSENQAQVDTFLAANAQFRLLPVPEIWAKALPDTRCPTTEPTLQLTPGKHGTDGFFVAVFERLAAAATSTSSDPSPGLHGDAFTVRPATEADLAGIAEIHLRGWERTYDGFMSPEDLAERSVEKRLPAWRAHIADPANLILVGELDGVLKGFVFGGPVLGHDMVSGDLAGFDCEIYSLHCLAEIEGRGLGRALIGAAARHWQTLGRKALMLWAYRDNAYRDYYARLGGAVIAEGLDDGLPDVAYGWRDLDALIARCGAPRDDRESMPPPLPSP